jgi:hypothetical protein
MTIFNYEILRYNNLKMQISFTGTSPGPIVEVSGGKKCQMVVS